MAGFDSGLSVCVAQEARRLCTALAQIRLQFPEIEKGWTGVRFLVSVNRRLERGDDVRATVINVAASLFFVDENNLACVAGVGSEALQSRGVRSLAPGSLRARL